MISWKNSLRAERRRKLAEVTLYLPTRRAGRMAQEIFLDVLGTDAVLLPRIVPLGDVDEEELAFAQAASPEALERLDAPPALDGLQRRLLLAQLIAAWAKQLAPGDPGRDAARGRWPRLSRSLWPTILRG